MIGLVKLNADLGQIAESKLCRRKGADGEHYYHTSYEIEVTYYSAHTKYELIYDGHNYGAVSAEYV